MTSSGQLVSVIVPARNAASYVGAAVESALRGTYRHLEVIVADDGSTDDTIGAVQSISDPANSIIPGGPSNASAARNRALRAASGELIAFLDADDLWYPQKLERQVPAFDDDDVVAVGALFRFRVGRRAFGVRGLRITDDRLALVRQALLMPLTFSSVVVRREPLFDTGLFDESLPVAADLDLLARLAQRGDVRLVEELLGEYRIHPGGLSRTGSREYEHWVSFIEHRTAARLAGGDLTKAAFDETVGEPSRRQLRRSASARSYKHAGVLAASGQPFRAVGAALAALVRDPQYTLSKVSQQRPWKRSTAT